MTEFGQHTEEARILREAEERGGGKKFKAYAKLSGPGWLQSALTLGAGSLAGSLYLGVLSGYNMLWLQPVAMVLGLIMMSAIAYVSLSIRERPLDAVNRHINPVLGFGWALAALAACMVWVMPQYVLANAVMQQNLFPELVGPASALGDTWGKALVTGAITLIVVTVTWRYGKGGWGIRLYEWIIKSMVLAIVLCFAGVVIRLAVTPEGFAWGEIFRGLIPNPAAILRPAEAFQQALAGVPEEFRAYWTGEIFQSQRDVAVTVIAATIGINATFLYAYSLRSKGWGPEFRGFVKFDLFTGMHIPFILVTAFVVIAGAFQFHGKPQAGLLEESSDVQAVSAVHRTHYRELLAGRALYQMAETGESGKAERIRELQALGEEEDPLLAELEERMAALPQADHRLAAMLVRRDALDLAASLKPFAGPFISRIVFGLGVLGITLSTITLHMLISGFVICELFGRPTGGVTFRLGTLAAATGVFAPFFWAQAAPWLVVPTSILAFMLLPIAYIAFFLMMNSRPLLGEEIPRGGRRWAWNTAMGLVMALVIPASLYMVYDKGGGYGMLAVVVFVAAVFVVHFLRRDGARTEK
jgi:Mn2+/Fe2+ NRAMP family transporter